LGSYYDKASAVRQAALLKGSRVEDVMVDRSVLCRLYYGLFTDSPMLSGKTPYFRTRAGMVLSSRLRIEIGVLLISKIIHSISEPFSKCFVF
jgi:hypothetical protein